MPTKPCRNCGLLFKPTGHNHCYCRYCAPIVDKQKKAEYQKRYRSNLVKRSNALPPATDRDKDDCPEWTSHRIRAEYHLSGIYASKFPRGHCDVCGQPIGPNCTWHADGLGIRHYRCELLNSHQHLTAMPIRASVNLDIV